LGDDLWRVALLEIVARNLKGHIDFIAQNVVTADFEDPVFAPYTMRQVNGAQVAVIGQAFPYTPIANPRRFVPECDRHPRGTDAEDVHTCAPRARRGDSAFTQRHRRRFEDGGARACIDVILGGHTHDAVPRPIAVANRGGRRW